MNVFSCGGRYSSVTLLTIVCLTAMATCPARAQNQARLDSMASLLGTMKNDSNKILTLARLAINYRSVDINRSLDYARQVIRTLPSVDVPPRRLARTYNGIGSAYIMAGRYDSARILLNTGLEISRRNNDVYAQIELNNSLGIACNYQNNYVQAIDYFLKALELAREHKQSATRTLGSIASSYRGMGNLEQTTRYNLEAIAEAIKEKDEMARYLITANQAPVYTDMGEYQKAREFLAACAAYHEKTGNFHALLQDYLSLGDLAFEMGDYRAQYKYGEQARALAVKVNSVRDRSHALVHMATSSYTLEDMEHAEEYAREVWAQADSSRLDMLKKNKIVQLLAKIMLYNRDIQQASRYFKISDSLTAAVNLEQQKTATADIMTRYETEKKTQENTMLRQQQAAQQRRIVIIAGFLSVVVVLLIILFLLLRRQRHANELLQRKNIEIAEQREEIISQNEEIEKQNKSLSQALRDLRETQAQLLHSEKMASLGQLTAGITHEINNPLNFIKLGVENLEEVLEALEKVVTRYAQLLPPEQAAAQEHEAFFKNIREFSKIIHMGSVRTSNIISGLRRFSHKGVEVARPTSIKQVIDETLVLIGAATADRIKVVTAFEPNLPVITIKAMEMGQALLNILINATQSITGNGTINIHVGVDDSWLAIRIQDTGAGIQPEHLDKIFDPFFTTKDVGKGTGLGLSITHNIIKNHEGTIHFESTVGKGTTCIVRLPI